MGIRNLPKLFTFILWYGLYGKPSSKGELTMVLEKTPAIRPSCPRCCVVVAGAGLVGVTVPYLWDPLLHTSACESHGVSERKCGMLLMLSPSRKAIRRCHKACNNE